MRRVQGMRATTPAAGFAVASVALVLAVAGLVVASPVLDDEALALGFVRQLGELVDGGGVVEAAAAAERLAAVAGAAGEVPPSAAAGPTQPEQMIFKDCVSAETLRAILGMPRGAP